MKQSVTLKWGSLKGWDGIEAGTAARAALEKYHAEPVSFSAAMQRDTESQKIALCELIDAVDEVWNDWEGGTMEKEAAKEYVMGYGK